MDITLRLNDIDQQRFSDAVEASFEVRNRQQFFVWTQSAVQGLVPHQILICGIRDSAVQSMLIQHFSASRYFRDEHFEQVSDTATGLLPQLVAVAGHVGEPIVFSPLEGGGAHGARLHAFVESNELKNLAARLISDVSGQVDAFYGFARVSVALDVRLQRRIELLLPHIHSTFLRVVTGEREVSMLGEQRSNCAITPRQIEILGLIRDGKNNAEIAQVLECSQWTVKNHIHNILKRLGTNNRAHALVQAMRLGILRHD